MREAVRELVKGILKQLKEEDAWVVRVRLEALLTCMDNVSEYYWEAMIKGLFHVPLTTGDENIEEEDCRASNP